MKTNLKLVGNNQPIDIYTAERERIMARDWARVHVAGDNAKPLPSWFGKR